MPPAPFSFARDRGRRGSIRPGRGHDFDISGLKPCAYILWCSATVKLTEGWDSPDATEWDVIAFCKGS